MKTLTTLTAVAALMTSPALADAFTDAVVAGLQARGYDYIEIKEGPTQVKAEAVQGNERVEIVWDRATGEILDSEREAAEPDEIGLTGLEISTEDEDFVEDNDNDNDNDDDDDDEDEEAGDDDDGDDDDSNDDESDDDDDEDDGDDDDDEDEDEDEDDEDEDEDEGDDDDDA